MDLSVIIVNWNTAHLLADCLQAVRSTAQDFDYEVIVLDNASSDGSADMLRERFSWVRLVESQENLGFARGNNEALLHATGEYLLLLNPDTVVQEGAIHVLVQVLRACPGLGAVGAQLLNPDGSLQESWGRFPGLQTEVPIVNRLLRSEPAPFECETLSAESSPLSVDWVSGACLMMRRETLGQVGPLDQDYWLYTEETDWCYRARAAGWQIALVPGAQVVHIARAASRQAAVKTMQHYYRSRLLFLSKHRGSLQPWLVEGILAFKTLVWLLVPALSPLAQVYPDLTHTEVRRAYRQLLRSMPLLSKGESRP